MDFYVECGNCAFMQGPYHYANQTEKVVRVCGECGSDVCQNCQEEHDEECSRKGWGVGEPEGES